MQPPPFSRSSSSLTFTILWCVVFVDLIGFGILAPQIAFYALRTGIRPEMVTLLVATYSLAQFVAMPVWGTVSDRYGRKPVLAISMAGHVVSYIILACAESWPTLLAARVIGGVTSANLAVAYAWVADSSTVEERPRYMGRLSAAFGMGFIFGPIIGGVLSGHGDIDQANFVYPALTSAALSALSLAGILLFLPAVRPSGKSGGSTARPGGLQFLKGLRRVSRQPRIAGLTLLCVLVITFVAGREAIFSIWANDVHGLGPRDIGILLGVSGATITLFQFFVMGPLSAHFDSFILVRASLIIYCVSWAGLLMAGNVKQIAVATMTGAIGTALFQTNMQTLVSREAPASERGLVMGIYQSGNSMARFFGQAGVGSLYAFLSPSAPFLIGALMMGPALFLLAWTRRVRQLQTHMAE